MLQVTFGQSPSFGAKKKSILCDFLWAHLFGPFYLTPCVFSLLPPLRSSPPPCPPKRSSAASLAAPASPSRPAARMARSAAAFAPEAYVARRHDHSLLPRHACVCVAHREPCEPHQYRPGETHCANYCVDWRFSAATTYSHPYIATARFSRHTVCLLRWTRYVTSCARVRDAPLFLPILHRSALTIL